MVCVPIDEGFATFLVAMATAMWTIYQGYQHSKSYQAITQLQENQRLLMRENVEISRIQFPQKPEQKS